MIKSFINGEPEMEIGLPVDVWRPIHVEATAKGLIGLPKHYQVRVEALVWWLWETTHV